jgi:hypothetical protein
MINAERVVDSDPSILLLVASTRSMMERAAVLEACAESAWRAGMGRGGCALHCNFRTGIAGVPGSLISRAEGCDRYWRKIDKDASNTYAGKSFLGITKQAWRIAVAASIVAYAIIWCFKHAPHLWVVWGSLFLATMVVLSIVAYWKSGEKIGPVRFVAFYGPTGSVVVQQLPDIVEKAWPLVLYG